jgi:hypothetical protein
MKGLHRDMSGNVIGGYTEDGRGFGTRSQPGGGLRGLAKWEALNPGKSATAPYSPPSVDTVAARPGSPLLAQRQKLFQSMQTAGAGGITAGMKKQAGSLGVTGQGFRRALGKIGQAPQMIAKPQSPPVNFTGIRALGRPLKRPA